MVNKKKITDSELERTLGAIKDSVRKLAEHAPVGNHGFPEYYPSVQGTRMLNHMDTWLLDEEQKGVLNRDGWSVFYLHASAYLCDIGWGMENGGPIDLKDVRIDAEISAATDVIMAASSKRLLENWRELGIGTKDQAEIIAGICHPGSNDLRTADGNPEDGHPETSLMSACIRFAKVLDLEAPATAMAVWQQLRPPNGLSPAELASHFDVIETGAHPYLSGTIRIKIKCRHPEVHRALKHHERAVQSLLGEINQRVSPRFLHSDVIYEIEPDGYAPVDMKFAVDSSAALQLFMGNRLYSDKRVFLRELIQNAADACRLRMLTEGDYKPEISISFNKDISIITVRDNGIGMSRQWIEKYFLSIGISFYRSGEVRSIKRNPRLDVGFISQFGIGFLSSFIVAERIVIKTKKTGSKGLVITITDLKDYFDVRPLERSEKSGTEVILHLKQRKGLYSRSMEYPGYLRTHIRYLGIPVNLEDEKGNISVLGNEKMAYTDGETSGLDLVVKLGLVDSEGYLLLSAKRHSDHTLYALESVIGGISIFQDGIFVTQIDTLLPEGARRLVAGRINLLGSEKSELSMDRNRIFWSQNQIKSLKKTIQHGLVDVANQLMAVVRDQDLSVNTRNSILNHVSMFFDFADVDDEMYRKLCGSIRRVVAKRFTDFLRINFAHAFKSAGIAGADEYVETWQQDIIAAFACRKDEGQESSNLNTERKE